MNEIKLPVPDDMHVHFRSGPMLRAVLPYHARVFARALVMPNRPWIGDFLAMTRYRDEIRRAAEAVGCPDFQPLMTIALEDDTTIAMIEEAHARGAVAAKLYPLGATTGPESGGARGVADPLSARIRAVYRAMADCGMVLCVHAECPPPHPRLRRERGYVHTVETIAAENRKFRVVVEHISSRSMINFVWTSDDNVAATITVHHLVDTIDDALDSPHHICNPIPKHQHDREMLWALIQCCPGKVFFGSDSAPHPVSAKYCARPACGCFTAPGLLPRLAQMFESRGLLDRLGPFVGQYGADFYGLPSNEGTLKLVKGPSKVPEEIRVPPPDNVGLPWQYDDCVVVWRGGETLDWQIAGDGRLVGG